MSVAIKLRGAIARLASAILTPVITGFSPRNQATSIRVPESAGQKKPSAFNLRPQLHTFHDLFSRGVPVRTAVTEAKHEETLSSRGGIVILQVLKSRRTEHCVDDHRSARHL